MFEVEVKVRADLDAVRDRLLARGAEPVNDVTQVDTYFDAPHRDFAETDEAIRIRREHREDDTTARLTYKGPLVDADSKTREEVEASIANGDDVRAIFENLGFEPAATVRKDRERFRVDGCTVTLDAVADVGEFVEVETAAETEAEIDAARESAFAVLRDLELDPDEQVCTSYLGMLLAGEDSSE
ncbi:MAG: class IV adenylate cyclase [Haloarculaceae archaeon]